jgi:hypothetical protein
MKALNSSEHGITTFAHFVQAVQRGAENVYMHDASIDVLCPDILTDLRVPKYFQVDLQKQLPLEIRSRHKCDSEHGGASHPSLFIGAPQTSTGLHIDSRETSFWMVVLSGTKTFRLVHPQHVGALQPGGEAAGTGAPASWLDFHADLFDKGKVAQLGEATVWEAVLNPGDIIYIPAGWPHQVQNGPALSVAVSYNFVGVADIDAHMQYLDFSMRHSSHAELSQLQLAWMRFSPRFPVLTARYSNAPDLSWREYFHAQTTHASLETLYSEVGPRMRELALFMRFDPKTNATRKASAPLSEGDSFQTDPDGEPFESEEEEDGDGAESDEHDL